MSTKPRTARLHEPKYREREPMEIDDETSPVDFDALASVALLTLSPVSINPLMAERMKEAGLV